MFHAQKIAGPITIDAVPCGDQAVCVDEEEKATSELTLQDFNIHMGRRSFIHKVTHDALRPFGVRKGDQLICEQTLVEDGNIVVVLHAGKPTARVYCLSEGVPLERATVRPGFAPSEASAPAEDLVILGRVKGLVRVAN